MIGKRWAAAALAIGWGAGGVLGEVRGQEAEPAYRSPYRVEFTRPIGELIGDLERTERGDRKLEADMPHARWYSEATRERWKAWGPAARHYPPLEGIGSWSVERKRERVVAVAMRYLGYGYQHHHIPDWDPPADWPWLTTCVGSNGKGVDCSNLTGFVYNQGFGLRLNTDIARQAEARTAPETDNRVPVRLHEVTLPAAYPDRIAALRTGDLLYIKSLKGEVSHVVVWIGPIGRSPDGTPLILDSHGSGVRDSENHLIPCGVHLRPFRENSWYNKSASHALRIFPDREG